jgi:phenylalanyl-tRNA synthetase beta chain
MKISYQWLKDYVPLEIKPELLAHKMTMAGLEVENIHTVKDDTIFEIEVTPNRPDCLSMLGMAREVAAILDVQRKASSPPNTAMPEQACDVVIEDAAGCARYIATRMKAVSVKPAPSFMRERIVAVGLRPINNIVDITNFCLMETGQPLHAFDYDKLKGGKIIVRRARKGEKIITIDDQERSLDPSILVIADAQRPVAIAGVMGGKDTEVTDATQNILLESAYFDPILIRRASRKLGLSSDSSYRFERGVDYQGVASGAHRAIELILEDAGAQVTHFSDCQEAIAKEPTEPIAVDFEKINRFLGASLERERYVHILQQLDFEITDQPDPIMVRPPSFRGDVQEEVDVIEEIARIVGYDQLPYSIPTIVTGRMQTNAARIQRHKVKECLVAQGFNEMISYTMISQDLLRRSNQQDNAEGTGIINPLTVDQEILRPSLLPSMLQVALFNINRGEKDLKLFETGKAYLKGEEKERLGILMTGKRTQDWRSPQDQFVDFFDLKGAVEQVLVRHRIHDYRCQPSETAYFGEMSASVMLGKNVLGEMGSVVHEVLDQWGIKQKGLYYAELDLDLLYGKMQDKGTLQPISEYPSIVWDISLAVKKNIPFEKIKSIAEERGAPLLQKIELKEEYLGDKISDQERGIIFSLVYQSQDKTLTEDEVSVVHERISQALIDQLEAVKR